MRNRDYKKEYENYDGKPEVRARRALRDKARRLLAKEGKVHKGDGKDVDHKTPLSKGGSADRSNLRVVSAKANRSYKRKSDGSIK
jgi:hypothetical protein